MHWETYAQMLRLDNLAASIGEEPGAGTAKQRRSSFCTPGLVAGPDGSVRFSADVPTVFKDNHFLCKKPCTEYGYPVCLSYEHHIY